MEKRKGDRNKYIELKRRFKQLCEKTKNEKTEQMVEEIKKAIGYRLYIQAIGYRLQISRNISTREEKEVTLGKSNTIKDWHKYSCEILEGRDIEVIGGIINIGEDDEEELADEEIEQRIKNLKKKKERGCR